jgi:hypothetical protein
MNYHIINCPDNINLSDLEWKLNASIILREENDSGNIEYSDLRPGHFMRMMKGRINDGKYYIFRRVLWTKLLNNSQWLRMTDIEEFIQIRTIGGKKLEGIKL